MIYTVWFPRDQRQDVWIHRVRFRDGQFLDERTRLAKGLFLGEFPGFQFSRTTLHEVAEVIKTCACGGHIYGMENGKKQKA